VSFYSNVILYSVLKSLCRTSYPGP